MTYYSLLIFLILSSFPVFGAQRAVVRNEKAIIYAEIERVTPIGYVIKGKSITVGDIPRGPYRMLPIVVSGRLCHIQEADLFINEYDQKNKRKSPPALTNTTSTDSGNDQVQIFSKSRSVEVSYQKFSAGNEWNQNYKDTFGVEANPSVSNLSGRYFIKNFSGFNAGLGLDLYSLSQEKASASILGLGIEINRIVWENNLFVIKPSLSLISSINFKNYGYRFNFPFGYHLSRNFDVKAGFGYQSMALTGMDIGGVSRDIKWSGLNLLASLEYYF
jgi:hypothetical protein